MFCKHEWEIKDKTVFQSAFEQLIEYGMPENFKGQIAFFIKEYVLIMVCKKCGKVDKTIKEV